MVKKIIPVILSLMLSVCMAGCQGQSGNSDGETALETENQMIDTEENQTESVKRTIIDHEGTEMEIPDQINRIVVTAWQLPAPLAIYLGGAEKIVGIAPASMAAAQNSIFSDVYPEILNASTAFYEGGNLNMEELLKLNPDIVIGASGDMAESIREAGIPAVSFSVSEWDYDVIKTNEEWIKLFDAIFGSSEVSSRVSEYSKLVQKNIDAKVSALSEEERKKVMFLFTYGDGAMTTSGKYFFGQSWCDLTGSINVGEVIEAAGSASISMEQVYEWNPDVIIITNFTSAQPEDLYTNAIGNDDWSSVNAVKNKQVYKMPLGWYRSYTPGVDTAVTLQWVAKAVYPELFEEIDINQVAKEYFKTYYQIELTDEQIENIFNPPREASAY